MGRVPQMEQERHYIIIPNVDTGKGRLGWLEIYTRPIGMSRTGKSADM